MRLMFITIALLVVLKIVVNILVYRDISKTKTTVRLQQSTPPLHCDPQMGHPDNEGNA
jgi:hypothetical protein